MAKRIVDRLLLEEEAVQTDTGVAYTLGADDAESHVRLNNAGAITATIPKDSTVNFPVGTEIDLVQAGAGAITVAGAAEVTVVGRTGLKSAGQYSMLQLLKIAANSWYVLGEKAA